MKRSIFVLTLGLLLAACGAGTSGNGPADLASAGQAGDPAAGNSICGTGDDTRPTPVGIAELEQAAGEISGAGSSFVAPLMSVWSGEFEQATGAKVDYASVGSGAGVKQISAGAVDFGASDAPMNDDELKAATDGAILHVPLVFGAVAPTYHLTGLKTPLQFTGEVLGRIFAGQITRWDDPELKTLNPGVDLPSSDILVVHRSDSSGTTAIFTEYLTKTSPSWVQALGDKSAGKEVPWPLGSVGKGNEGVSAFIKQTEGALGYVELTYALSNGLAVGHVKNRAGKFIPPCFETVTAAARDIAIPEDLRFSLTETPGIDAYPITGTVWALVHEQQKDETRAKTLVNFLVWALDEGQNKARSHNYAPLSPEVQSLAISQVKRISLDGKPLAE